ncbi:iron-containing alcohol dehydrogenase [Halonatronum saccharophilum]|uniref:iron-containing alcohol dehydrogenase n=1 Tax=Halonatronum saccharophilum TaxID=150060 RepID=UPI000486AA2B|nr:iron-containing alcohol dehydrogenase [Halonatronum saccharophilum]
MKNFNFSNKTEIIFGRGSERKLGKKTKAFSNKILLHYGGGSIKKYGVYDKVVDSLKESGVEFIELGGVKPNPRLSLVKEGIDICRKKDINFILAVGGGSVIDSAKAIAAGVSYDGDVWDFFDGKARPKEVLNIGVVLTIPAAGSETSAGTVVTKEEGWYKQSFGTDELRPKFAILNPETTFTLPPYQTAAGAVDIIAHVMERYFTKVSNVDLTDRLCEATLKTMIKNVPIVLENSEDYDARAEIMWAGTIAHNGLLGTGRIGDWASHNIEHELSAIYDVAHGAGLAVIFPAWMQYVYKQDINRFAQFATRVFGVEYDFNDPERTVIEGIRRLKSFFKSIGMPVTLEELGVEDNRFEEMATKCIEIYGDGLGSFMKLDKEDIIKIYELAK